MTNISKSNIFQIIGAAFWCLLLSPGILVITAQQTIHPAFTEKFTASDVFYLLNEIFTTPGIYYGWLLSATGLNFAEEHWFTWLISALLFSPFFIWPFLRSERYRFLRKILCVGTVVFVFLCLGLSAYIFMR